jgi:multidrug efflux pump subunit AcrB
MTPRLLLPVLLVSVGCSRPPANPDAPVVPQPPALPVPVAEVKPAGPVVRVTAKYPGANAQVVANTVAAPIEHNLNGAEGIERLESESREGSYTLLIRFKPGTEDPLAVATVLNLVKGSDPKLPEEVRRQGATVDQYNPTRFPPLWVALTSPDGTRDGLFLGNYAALKVRDELARVAGVADVRAVGGNDSAMRIWLGADKLAARKLTAQTVLATVQRQNVQVAAGQIGQPAQPAGATLALTVTSLGRLSKVEDLEGIVVATGEGGQIVYLRDVARVELAARGGNGFARADGKPAAVFAVHTQADDKITADDLRRVVADIEKVALKGVKPELVSDSVTVVELRLPSAARIDRTEEATQHAEQVLAALDGVAGTLAFAEGSDGTATLLVKPAARNPATPSAIRKALADLREAAARVSDVSSGGPFPVQIALTDSGLHGDEKLRQWADAVAQRLERDGIVADPAVDPGPSVPQLILDIDREKAEKLGVKSDDIFHALQANLGAISVNDFNKFGRTYRVTAQPERNAVDVLKRLDVRNRDGERVPLGTLVHANSVVAPPAIFRVNLHPALRITAAPPDGKSTAEATSKCAEIAEAVRVELKLPDSFKATNQTAGTSR